MSNAITISNGAVSNILSPKGNVTGARYALGAGGNTTPSELRDSLKAKGLKGNKLSKTVREVMRGNQSIAWANMQAGVEALRAMEQVPTVMDVREKSAVIRFVSIKEAVAKVKKDSYEIFAASIGLTVEELKAKLTA